MTSITRERLEAVAQYIQALEFGTVFDLTPEGMVNFRSDVYAPEVFHDEDPQGDITGYGAGWTPLNGMSNQYAYHGACMHPSEFIGSGIADRLMHLAQDEAQTFTVVVVESFDEDDMDAVGWAILHYTPKEN